MLFNMDGKKANHMVSNPHVTLEQSCTSPFNIQNFKENRHSDEKK